MEVVALKGLTYGLLGWWSNRGVGKRTSSPSSHSRGRAKDPFKRLASNGLFSQQPTPSVSTSCPVFEASVPETHSSTPTHVRWESGISSNLSNSQTSSPVHCRANRCSIEVVGGARSAVQSLLPVGAVVVHGESHFFRDCARAHSSRRWATSSVSCILSRLG